MSNFHPFSSPESGILTCSARQERNLPLSSMVGTKVNTDVVVLPSEFVWNLEWNIINSYIVLEGHESGSDFLKTFEMIRKCAYPLK